MDHFRIVDALKLIILFNGASLTLGPLLQCAVALPPSRQPLAHSTSPHLHRTSAHRTHIRVRTRNTDQHPPPSTLAYTLHSITSCETTSCGTNPSLAGSHSRTSTAGMKSDVQAGQVSSSRSATSTAIGEMFNSPSSVLDQFHTQTHTPELVPSVSESHTPVLSPSVSHSHIAKLVQSLSTSHSSNFVPSVSDTRLQEQVPSVRTSHTQSQSVNSKTPATPPTGVGLPLKYQLILYIVPPVMVVVCCLVCLTLCLCLRRYRKTRRYRRRLIPLTDHDGSDESEDEEELDYREPAFLVTPTTRPMLAFADT